jgi:hypothetical protein
MTSTKKILVLFCLALFLLSAAGSAFASGKFVTIVTGSTGGTYYPIGTILANHFNAALMDKGYKWSAQSSGGTVENLDMMQRSEAEMAIAMANLTGFAYTGTVRYEGKKIENLRYVMGLWPDVTHSCERLLRHQNMGRPEGQEVPTCRLRKEFSSRFLGPRGAYFRRHRAVRGLLATALQTAVSLQRQPAAHRGAELSTTSGHAEYVAIKRKLRRPFPPPPKNKKKKKKKRKTKGKKKKNKKKKSRKRGKKKKVKKKKKGRKEKKKRGKKKKKKEKKKKKKKKKGVLKPIQTRRRNSGWPESSPPFSSGRMCPKSSSMTC